MNVKETIGVRPDPDLVRRKLKSPTKASWNPVLLAIDGGHLKCIRFLLEEVGVNLRLAIKDPNFWDETQLGMPNSQAK